MPSDIEPSSDVGPPPQIDPRLARILDQIPQWRGKVEAVAPLGGGLTNVNYRVDVDGTPFVVRIPGEATELLGIDRASERRHTQAAARLGVGPRLITHVDDPPAMVLEFIHGRTMSQAGLGEPGMPARVAAAVRDLHRCEGFTRAFDMLTVFDRYWEVIAAAGLSLPAGFAAHLGQVRAICGALRPGTSPTTPCHNDLLPENFIDDGVRLRIVDYEYSGFGDLYFELGNLSQEMLYNESQIAELCRAYFGNVTGERLARVQLQMIMSDAIWSLWAFIQAGISRLDFDFVSYGQNRWDRAQAKLDRGATQPWLEALRPR